MPVSGTLPRLANLAGGEVSRPLQRALLGMLACSGSALHAQVTEPRVAPALRLTPAWTLAAVTEPASAPTQTPAPSPAPAVAPTTTLPATAPVMTTTPIAGERLSDWLLRQPADPRAYAAGLIWQVPGERYPQAGLKRELLTWLKLSDSAPAAARANLVRLIEALPVTGRVSVPIADARWLQGRPQDDPVLQRDHVLSLPWRPSTVTVLTHEGRRCTLPHQPRGEARDYLSACEPRRLDRVDRTWLVQPDGTVREFGIARWNAQKQEEAAPGAFIWAPARDSGWSPQFSMLLARFLATQAYDNVLALAGPAIAEPSVAAVAPATPSRDAVLTANDWGMIGLLQTPTARMSKAGEARFHYSRVDPYERSNVIFQPLDWLEAGFRYTNIRNRLYGEESLSGDQTFKDKSVDFKVRLFRETAYTPELAVGVIDIGGTGFFSSEYLVANKRTGNFDWSLGIGWGNLGASGNIRNPLSLLNKGFENRAGASGIAGNVDTNAFFRGPAALFGGVQYHTPSEKWLFKAEYDGNNYRNEPQANNQPQRSPINVGVVYRYHPAVDISFGIERGDTLMLGLTLHTALDKLDAPKLSNAPAPRVSASRRTEEAFWPGTVSEIGAVTGWSVKQISRQGDTLQVVIESAQGAYWNERIERLTAVLHRDAPAPISAFELIFIEQGIPLTERVILREPWVKKNLQYQAMADSFHAAAAVEPRGALPATPLWQNQQPRFGYSLIPTWQQNLGGPDGFLLFSAGFSTPARLKLSESTSITGTLSVGLLDNYDKFKYTAPSAIPRVRTFLRESITSSPITMPNLQITHVGQWRTNEYYSLYGGYLESMFAGVGGEWLYRPWHSPFAFGIDVNRVQQRNFEQNFGFGNAGSQTGYRVTTGHASAYWDTGWQSTQVKLSVGRYLARDIGATMDISRRFDNGVTIGAWATKTNLSAAEFGEGSFDKGIYLRVPFDVMTTSLSGGTANLVWNPLTRDGGAKLSRGTPLYNLTNSRSKRETGYFPPGPGTSFDDEVPAWAKERSLLGDFLGTGLGLGGQVARGETGRALWLSGGIVLASTLLDRPVANWAKNHQGGGWNKLGKASSAIPLALAAGTGVLWWGMAGEGPTETAWTAIKSGALTLAADAILTRAVNRARPEAELGIAHFGATGKGASNSGFPSTHMGAAFALVTPFAQQYDASWLYAVAGATGFGRVQERKHFVSDVVAGSLLGYLTGSLLLDQQRNKRKGANITIGPDRSITSAWTF
jgi:membrane-associated phospholipid phosphatase